MTENEIMDMLRSATPDWVQNGGIRGNPETIATAKAPTEWPPCQITQRDVQEPESFKPYSPTTPEGVTEAEVTDFPFHVTQGVNSSGDATWSVHLGYISTIATTGTDTPVDSDSGDFSIYVKVTVALDTSNNYRLITSAAAITTDNAETCEPALVVTWVDPDTKADGTWFVKVADISADAGPPVTITDVVQVLSHNIVAYVVAGDEVVVLTEI